MKRAMQILNGESGQVLVTGVICIGLLMGFMAVAIDVGLLYRAKRIMQIAADAGAVDGAAELPIGDWSEAGNAGAALNGFSNGVNGATVSVNNPPVYGAYAGNSHYVEVIVSESEPVFFMKVFGYGAMTVTARAVATDVPASTCIYTLSSASAGSSDSPAGGVYVTGSADLNLPSCGILDDGTGSYAVHVTGGATLTAEALGIVGTDTVHNGGVLKPSSPVTGMTPVSDPLAGTVSPPPSSDYSSGCSSATYGTGTYTVGPSSPTGYVCYSSFTVSKGSPTINFNPGLYIFNGSGGLNIGSGTILNGTGVTFYFVNGASFTISNGATANLSAPTSGAYSGFLFYQDPTDSAADSIVGGSSAGVNGIFYLPDANLTLANGTSTTFDVDLVVGSLTMSGNATLDPYSPTDGASPLSSPTLAE
jgi:hypothetical protein